MLVITIGEWEFFLTILGPPARLSDLCTWPLYGAECFVNTLIFVYMSRLILILHTTTLFHTNLVRISQALFITYYPGVAARVVLFLYEVKVLRPEGNYIHSGVIVAACFMRLWCINVLMYYLPSAIIERVFASKYVADYERCPRPLINRAIISIVFIYAAVNPIFDMLGYSNLSFKTWGTAVMVIGYCIAYVTLYRRDLVKLRNISRGIHRRNAIYTLSTKFQLKENLRVMKILMQLSIMWTACILVACLSFMLATYMLAGDSQWSGYVLAQLFFAVSYIVIVSVFTVAVGGARLRSLLPFNTKIGVMHVARAVDDHRGASDAYFRQLNTTWD